MKVVAREISSRPLRKVKDGGFFIVQVYFCMKKEMRE